MVGRSDAVDLTEVARLRLRGPIRAIAWSQDGSHLAAIVGNDVVTWDAASWTEERRFPVLRRPYMGQSLAYADGGLLAGAPDPIAPYNGPAAAYVPAAALTLWDPLTGSPLKSFPAPAQRSPDGPTHTQDIFAVSRDGEKIAAVDSMPFDPVLFIYDMATGAILHVVPVPPVPRPPPQFDSVPQPDAEVQEIFSAVAFSPVDARIGACGSSGRAYIVDATTGAIVRVLPAYPEGVRCSAIAFSNDGKLLATGREPRRYGPVGHQPRPGDRMTLETDTGSVRVWDTASGGIIASFPHAVGATRALSWSPSGSTLVAGDDGSLKRWTFQGTTVTNATSSPLHSGVFGTAFSPDGRLAVLGEDGSIMIYR